MQTHYERLGGGDTIRKLVDRFYDLMDEDPDYYGIRKLHPADLTESRNKLFCFSPAGPVDRRSIPTASGIHFCAVVICRSPLATPSATSGWAA